VSVNPLGVGKEADVANTTLSSNAPATQTAHRPGKTFVDMLSATLTETHEEAPPAGGSERNATRTRSGAGVDTLMAASFEVTGLPLTNALARISASQRAFDRLRRNAYPATPPVTPAGESIGIDNEA